jgi:restriction endonuclease S subunit
MSVVEQAMTDKKVSYSFNNYNYLATVNGLSEYAANGSGGWMMTLNDWFTNEGSDAYTAANGRLTDGDVITVMYSCSWGADVGSLCGNTDTKLKNIKLDGASFSWSEDFSPSKTDWTITINPQNVDGKIGVIPEAYNKNYQVKTYLNKYTPEQPGTELKTLTRKLDVKKGDIFLTPSSEMPDDIGRFAVAIEDIPDACYSYHVNRLRPAIKLDLQYSAFMLNTKEYQDQITTLSEGSGKRYVISKSKFEKVKIHIPMDLREQNAIGYVLTSITSEIDSLIHEREKYLRLKDGMMQELLTGKTRLI